MIRLFEKGNGWWKWISAAMVSGLLLQLTNPPLKNPSILPGHDLLATNAPPRDIGILLRAACYNCHSSETRWPWYSHIAPVSWWLAGHVRDAREALNFSDWPQDQPARIRKRWRRIADMVEDREMPLPGYTLMHPESRLTDQQRTRLIEWARQTSDAGTN